MQTLAACVKFVLLGSQLDPNKAKFANSPVCKSGMHVIQGNTTLCQNFTIPPYCNLIFSTFSQTPPCSLSIFAIQFKKIANLLRLAHLLLMTHAFQAT